MTAAVVLNPASASFGPDLHATLLGRLPGARFAETTGGPDDGRALDRLLAEVSPDVLVVAGGDGTVSLAVGSIVRTGRRPGLVVVPTGTANNFARSLGFEPIRRGRPDLDRALASIDSGRRRVVDLGEVEGRPFAGSFAVGMDASILATRNRSRRNGRAGGYGAYLRSFSTNLLAPQGARARIVADGEVLESPAYNTLVTNGSIYAGEFRFSGASNLDDGRLDLLVFSGPLDYVAAYSMAWPRHLLAVRGLPLPGAGRLRAARAIEIRLDEPVAAQADGEEIPARDHWRVRALPGALDVRCL